MRIAKKATKGKGKQWKRGESSSCNPSTRKFRDKAKLAFSQQPSTNSSLTVEAVDAHNVVHLEKCVLSDEDSKSEVGTFASLWSNCSNSSFDKLLNNWQPSSVLHKEMLAIIAALTETIKEKGGKETETEYFAALMTTLGTVDTDEALTATVCLINMVVRRLPASVLKLKFSEASDVFRKLIKESVNSENGALLRGLISSLAFFLRAQELVVWKMTSTQEVFQEILSLTTHNKPRVRKAAHRAVISILRGSSIVTSGQVAHHPVSSIVANFCIQMIEKSPITGSVSLALQMLNLIKDALPLLPSVDVKRCCETILRMMTLGDVLVITTAFKIFNYFFVTQSKSEDLNFEFNLNVIVALYDYQPSVNDTQPICAWLTVMKEAHICLFRKNKEQCLRCIPQLVKAFTSCWLSDSETIYTCVENCFKEVLRCCLKEVVSDVSVDAMREIFSMLEKCISYQYMSAWGSLFNVLAVVFEVFGPEYPDAFKGLLKTIAEVREAFNFKYVSQFDSAVGAAIIYMGPEFVVNAIPLKLDFHLNDLTRSWLLPVLRENVKQPNLAFFVTYFIPLSQQIERKIEELNTEGKMVESKVYSVLNTQIWSLLPSFCNNARDLKSCFISIARKMGQILLHKEELRSYVLKAFKVLISSSMENDENKSEVSKYAKNFLPILLKLYTSSEEICAKDERLLIFDVIKLFLSISDAKTLMEQYENLMNNFSKLREGPSYRKYVLLDILRLFIAHIESGQVHDVYNKFISPFINDYSDEKTQKKIYLIVCEIIQSSKDEFLAKNAFDLLMSSLSRLGNSVKYIALRMMKSFIEDDLLKDEERKSALLSSALQEAVNALSINSAKTKTSAFDLIVAIGNYVDVSQLLNQLLDCYVPNNNCETLTSAIYALNRVLIVFNDQITSEQKGFLLKRAINCLKTENRSVIQAVLYFVKSWLKSLPKDKLISFVTVVIESLASLSEDNHKHFRFKVKEILTALVRKFGFDVISKMIPEMYRKTLKNIRKIEARKAKRDSDSIENESRKSKKSQSIDDILENTSDDDSLEQEIKDETYRPAKRIRSNAYIAETKDDEVLDLLGSDASKMIVSVDPKRKTRNENLGFAVTEDGKIVIGNDVADQSKGVKRKSMDDEDEEPMEHNTKEASPLQYKPGGRGIHRKVESSSAVPGEEYRSNKAKGDMKRKGKPDPYAYIPLTREALNKRKTKKFSGQFKNIVHSAKKGAEKGKKSQLKKKLKNSKRN